MTAYRLHSTVELCEHLLHRHVVYAPVADADGDARFSQLDAPLELAQPPLRPLLAAKAYLFAERESLFRFDGRRFIETLPETPPFVLFGLTACDLAAIRYQDRFFAEDRYYQRRRAAALLVGIDCQAPCAGGFCHVVDAGPRVRDDCADLALSPEAEGGCTLFVQTKKGEAALAGLALPLADAAAAQRRSATEQACTARMGDATHIRAGMARVQSGAVSAELWEQLGLQCVACSGCTNACPTCSCFATREQPAVGGSVRERFWDSCLLTGFAREASGHHPASAAGQRVERFYYHKLSDDFRRELGHYGCVGCGRCETVCPGSIGVHSTLRRLAES